MPLKVAEFCPEAEGNHIPYLFAAMVYLVAAMVYLVAVTVYLGAAVVYLVHSEYKAKLSSISVKFKLSLDINVYF